MAQSLHSSVWGSLCCPSFTEKKTGSKLLNDAPKITQLEWGKAGKEKNTGVFDAGTNNFYLLSPQILIE